MADFVWLGEQVANLGRMAESDRGCTKAQLRAWLVAGQVLEKRIADMQRWAVRKAVRRATGPLTQEDKVLALNEAPPPWNPNPWKKRK